MEQLTSLDAAESMANFLRATGVGIIATGRRGRAEPPLPKSGTTRSLPGADPGGCAATPPPALAGVPGAAASSDTCSWAPAGCTLFIRLVQHLPSLCHRFASDSISRK